MLGGLGHVRARSVVSTPTRLSEPQRASVCHRRKVYDEVDRSRSGGSPRSRTSRHPTEQSEGRHKTHKKTRRTTHQDPCRTRTCPAEIKEQVGQSRHPEFT